MAWAFDEHKRLELLSQLERAFSSVLKGTGIGPREADALDYYTDPQAARTRDVEQRWQEIPDQVLESTPTALCFTDRTGFQFLLPAFMRHGLEHPLSSSTILDSTLFALTRSSVSEFLRQYPLESGQVIFVARFLHFWMLENSSFVCTSQASEEVVLEWLERAGPSL